jgi:hypothetical protein
MNEELNKAAARNRKAQTDVESTLSTEGVRDDALPVSRLAAIYDEAAVALAELRRLTLEVLNS